MTISIEELQEMQDMLDGKLLLPDDEITHWMRKDLQKLITAYRTIKTQSDSKLMYDMRVVMENLAALVVKYAPSNIKMDGVYSLIEKAKTHSTGIHSLKK